MSYYVSAIQGAKSTLAVGPFRRHGDALAHVERFRRWATENTREAARFPDVGFGTARDRGNHRPGRMNAHYAVPMADGWCLPPT